MAYLHKHKMLHGNLKSNNCVVDDRWTCKVTDFGLQEYKRQDVELDADFLTGQHKMAACGVYRAPETRCKSGVTLAASDVYPFAIILVEVATRDDAYGSTDAYSALDDWKPPLPQLTPADQGKVDADHVCPSPRQYTKLIARCWADSPEERPTFESVTKTLQMINPSKLSAVDSMMAMMEKYSKHLETIAEERTQELMEEKQRTDALLYSMMPRKIAEQLKAGQLVGAEQFEACTIYFSDIVGFTDLSGRSSPLQVVDLLNKLYTTFDSIIEKHQVYKVETIGDAYMVVSGVPDKTEQHAGHVAMMSLEMVSASRNFEIPHMPTEALRIRVGLHSGSVCAGVVGIKMPRYCLFGDTVNTASRMESNGEAYKIHISEPTFVELQKQGRFVCEARGCITIKGKGDMMTWWLIRKDES